MIIDGGPATHRGVDIGNGNQQPGAVAGQGLRDGKLVEVEGVVVVDRDPVRAAQVTGIGVRGSAVERIGLGLGGGREIRQQAMIQHGLPRDRSEDVA